MSAPTLSSYPGKSAIERAADAWGFNDTQEIARHQKMMTALRRVESVAPVVSDVPADPFARDWQKWRKAKKANLQRQNRELEQKIERIRRC